MTDKNRQKGNESVGEKSDGLEMWQIMVAGPAGYVRREAFAGSSLAEALENVRKQGFAWVEDEGSGFPDVFVKMAAPEALGAAWVSEADILALLPGCYYMDPPDGGGVTPLEQLQRMAKDAARYRFIRSTTKAVRADDGEGRVEVTPEKFDAMTDISIEVHKDAEAQDAFYRAIRATKDQS